MSNVVTFPVGADSPLYEALQQAVQDVAPVPHQLEVMRRAVHTLAVQNGPLEHVAELLPRAWIPETRSAMRTSRGKGGGLLWVTTTTKPKLAPHLGSWGAQSPPCTSTRSGCSGAGSR